MGFIQKWLQAASGLFNTLTGAQAVQLVDDSGAAIGPTNKLPVEATVSAATLEIDTAGLATSAKQDTGNTSLAAILAKIVSVPALEGGNLATLAGKDFATQTTLAAILAKLVAAPALEGGNLADIKAAINAALGTQTAYLKTVNLTDVAQALGDAGVIGTVDVTAPEANAANATLTVGANTVAMEPGEYHSLAAVDLSTVTVTGTAGDTVTVVGTRRP